MAKALTVRAVESVKAGAERREIPDGLLRGLYLVIQPGSGSKSWAVRYRRDGLPRKHTIGNYPALDLVHAREMAAKALRAVAEGRDPGAEKQQARTAAPDTVAAVVADFIEKHCKRRNRSSTVEETERLFRLHVLPRWRNRPVQSITRDVRILLDQVIAGGSPVAANRTLAAVRLFFNWAVAHDIVAASPCAGVTRPTPETPRDRVLGASEITAVWHAATAMGGPFGPLVQLLVLTGARRDEVAQMRWSELDLVGCVWRLPPARTKNGKPHEIPLSTLAVAILQALPRIDDSDYVLTTNGRAAASNFGKNKRRFGALLPPDMPAWTLHDLRRSVASGMAKLGISLPVIEKVLNHTSGSFAGIVDVYQLHDFADEKRQALQRWASHIEQLITPTKVTALRGQR